MSELSSARTSPLSSIRMTSTRFTHALAAAILASASACNDSTPLAPDVAVGGIGASASARALSTSLDTLRVGKTLQLSSSLPLRGSRQLAGKLNWSTSSPSTASVTQSGLVSAITAGTAVITASNGKNEERTTIVVQSDTAPTSHPPTPPTPPVGPPAPTGSAAVTALIGAAPSSASTGALGGFWQRYEADFARMAEARWQEEGADYANANYYDRAQIYYAWWVRTGNPTYLDRANQLAINARSYMESVNYNPQPYLMMLDGVALHAMVTGDAHSAQVVARTADALGRPDSYWSQDIGVDNYWIDARTEARVLGAVLDAWYLKVPSPAGLDYAVRLRDLLTRVLSTQSPDGAYRLLGSCGENPFMSGILNDVLIRYYTVFEADPRVLSAVRRSVDFMWANMWSSSAGGFKYYEAACATGGDGPAADLNGLIVNGFGFIAKQTGDASYFAKGDAVFAGGVAGAYLIGSKQFNQQYTTSYRYLGYRFQ